MTPYTLTFRIDTLPLTANASFAKGHWARKKKRDEIKALVRLSIGSNRPATPLKMAKLTYTRGSSMEPDYDGLVSSFKSIQDSLVELGILFSDKISVTGIPTYSWERAPKGKGYCQVSINELVSP